MPVDASIALLRWYDANRRRLPWRTESGDRPDPYRVWLSEIMLQQTTVPAVRPYFEAFVRRWPTVQDLAATADSEVMSAWAGLGYYARARNLLAAARRVTELGAFPDSEGELRKLPGVGPYTAAAIAAIAFDRRAVVVDGNVERIVSRYFALESPLPSARKEIHGHMAQLTPEDRCGDFAQAMMDLGSSICTPRNPTCLVCPLAPGCEARRRGEQARFPVKRPRSAKPRRQGAAYWLEHDGHVMLVRRPGKGLLGGMLALPSGAWGEELNPGEGAPAAADWREAGSVDHVFTHFALTLHLYCASAPQRIDEGIWWAADRLEEAGLPTLFAKLARRGLEWRVSA